MTRPATISPADWARMSWHQRAKASAAWTRKLAALEAERPPARLPEPVVVGHYTALTNPAIRAQLRLDIAMIDNALNTAAGYAPHGTTAARRRHKRLGEDYCDECSATSRYLTPTEAETIHHLAGTGMSNRAIARSIGRSHRTIDHHLKENAA